MVSVPQVASALTLGFVTPSLVISMVPPVSHIITAGDCTSAAPDCQRPSKKFRGVSTKKGTQKVTSGNLGPDGKRRQNLQLLKEKG